jgi:hypothetical protein
MTPDLLAEYILKVFFALMVVAFCASMFGFFDKDK